LTLLLPVCLALMVAMSRYFTQKHLLFTDFYNSIALQTNMQMFLIPSVNVNFTLGVRASGQTYSQCLTSNTGNYSVAGVFNIQNEAGKFLAGNDVGNLLFGNASEGQAGLLFTHGGASAVSAGVGRAGTFGRRTASMFDLNLSGRTGPAPTILGKTGAE